MQKGGRLRRFRTFALGVVLCGAACGRTNGGGSASPSSTAASGGKAAAAGGGGEENPPTAGQAGSPTAAAAGEGSSGESGASPCVGLGCQVKSCPDSPEGTTISGQVFGPSGELPLYGAQVFIPIDAVPPLKDELSCGHCADDTQPNVAHAVTDETGNFILTSAPSGKNIPLVIQIGRWRRQLLIPNVKACSANPLDNPDELRLPKNRSEGDIPRIAIAAGGGDSMECFVRRLGIDDAEFTTKAGAGRIHLFAASGGTMENVPLTAFDPSLNEGATLPPATELWQDLTSLSSYDVVMLGCEGNTFPQQKPVLARQAMYDYASQGGRIFASHWQHIWFSAGPEPVPQVGTWTNRAHPTPLSEPITAKVNQSFPAGSAFAHWLVAAAISPTVGAVDVISARDNIQAVDPKLAQAWLTVENPHYPEAATTVQALSFDAPVGAASDQLCGRVVYTSAHVAGESSRTAGDPPPPGFPKNCEDFLSSKQEKALAFLFFHLSACSQE